jgi:hypothetical protein
LSDEENPGDPGQAGRGPFGTVLLVVGGLILLAAAFHDIGGLPFWMPPSWYQFPAMWIGLAVVCLIAGFVMLKPPKGDERDTT